VLCSALLPGWIWIWNGSTRDRIKGRTGEQEFEEGKGAGCKSSFREYYTTRRRGKGPECEKKRRGRDLSARKDGKGDPGALLQNECSARKLVETGKV